MKAKINTLSAILLAALFFSSCLGNDDDTERTDDAGIVSFTLGTLKRYMHTTSSEGEDSVYTTSVTGSSYKFYIDQINGLIYNPDSLPVNTNSAKTVCTIATVNSNGVGYKSLVSDTVWTYSSSDSIDFTEPRTFVVYSTNGTSWRTYKISVNVHREFADSFRWDSLGNVAAIAPLSDMKAVVMDGELLLFGVSGERTRILRTSTSDGHSWSEITPKIVLDDSTAGDITLDGGAAGNTVKQNGTLYTLSRAGGVGTLLRSDDGTTWTEVPHDGDIACLIGGGDAELYAYGADGALMSSADGGGHWTTDSVAGDPSLLPTQDMAYHRQALLTNDSTESVIIAGSRDADIYAADTTGYVWRRLVEYSSDGSAAPWQMITSAPDYKNYLLPRLRHLEMISYDDAILAVGGDGIGASEEEAFTRFYESRDGGLTWAPSDDCVLPESLSGDGSSFAMTVDDENHIWLIAGGSGQVWKGRLNRLGWAERETVFTQ